jgi:hypothetical protein
MKIPFIELKELLTEYNAVLHKAQTNTFFTVDTDLQHNEIENVAALLKKMSKEKKQSIKEQNETKANLLLCLGFAANAVQEELRMIISLKTNEAEAAWNCLINAQEMVAAVMRNHPFGADYLEGYGYKLQGYETLLFPKMTFSSAGFTIKSSQCSICKAPYANCDHIKGNAYMGQMCTEIIQKIERFEEVSIVDHPENKRCRILSYSEGNKRIDALTHREITD